jgi:mono/diheme cytochrome c family protein
MPTAMAKHAHFASKLCRGCWRAMWRLVICRIFGLAALLAASVGCSKSSSVVRTWRPSDHDQPSELGATTPAVLPADPRAAPGRDQGNPAMSTWVSLCANCHGHAGRGDGPMGSATGARDLSDPTWQASVADAQISQGITHGRGKMPRFSLQPEITGSLVSLIRGMARHGSAKRTPEAPAVTEE